MVQPHHTSKTLLLLVGNAVAAANVLDVVESAVPADVESSFLLARLLCGADTGRVGAAARSWVGISLWVGRSERERSDGGDDGKELHVGACLVVLGC